jgi:hypothetical protein
MKVRESRDIRRGWMGPGPMIISLEIGGLIRKIGLNSSLVGIYFIFPRFLRLQKTIFRRGGHFQFFFGQSFFKILSGLRDPTSKGIVIGPMGPTLEPDT